MDLKAKEELKRDLLHCGFLLVAPEMEGRRETVRNFYGSNMQDGRRYEVVISVKVEVAK